MHWSVVVNHSVGTRDAMASRLLAIIMAVGAITACGPAMSAPHDAPKCRVIGGEKLPAESGGPAAICSAVEQAIAARAPGVAYQVDIRVLSKSGLSATVVTGGRTLPELQFSVMDRNLGQASVERFAAGVADQLTKAAK